MLILNNIIFVRIAYIMNTFILNIVVLNLFALFISLFDQLVKLNGTRVNKVIEKLIRK